MFPCGAIQSEPLVSVVVGAANQRLASGVFDALGQIEPAVVQFVLPDLLACLAGNGVDGPPRLIGGLQRLLGGAGFQHQEASDQVTTPSPSRSATTCGSPTTVPNHMALPPRAPELDPLGKVAA